MNIKSQKTQQLNKKTSALCAFVFENAREPLGLPKLPAKLDAAVKQSIKESQGKFESISIIHTHQLIAAEKLVIVGLGKKQKTTTDSIRMVAGKIAQKIREQKLADFTIIVPEDLQFNVNQTVSAIVEGVEMSMYSFDKYKKEKKEGKVPDLTLVTSHSIDDVILKAKKIAESVNYTRDIANLPPNECSPAQLAGFAKSLAAKNNLKCTILSKSELKQKGFGGISAVGQGSKNEPKLIILEYRKGKRQDKPVVVVGKAVTFDTGGISIKPSEKMDEMKFDKCGGCTVLGIMKAASDLRLPVNLVGIIPSVENMPGGESYRPGDVVRLFGGKTAEILNTDAEGRVILADALAYGIKLYQPSEIMDFATLTGACIVALGANVAGLISNNKRITEKLKSSSARTSEQIWQLPIDDDFMDMIKSDVADIKNIGVGRAAGTITAAAFLANAVGNTPWAHFDIAGTAWIQTGSKPKSYNPKGATGFGVRLILDYLSN
ncbi:MAG TPA: leucyl aminopeptidase [Nitrosopumilaceae archaeon]|nr:leucyl aminopeptidase [Nitrosopumilaceae archaeon]